MVSIDGESDCSALHRFYIHLTILGVLVPNYRAVFEGGLTTVLYDVALALTDPVLRLCHMQLRVLVTLLTVIPMCCFNSYLLLRSLLHIQSFLLF